MPLGQIIPIWNQGQKSTHTAADFFSLNKWFNSPERKKLDQKISFKDSTRMIIFMPKLTGFLKKLFKRTQKLYSSFLKSCWWFGSQRLSYLQKKIFSGRNLFLIFLKQKKDLSFPFSCEAQIKPYMPNLLKSFHVARW